MLSLTDVSIHFAKMFKDDTDVQNNLAKPFTFLANNDYVGLGDKIDDYVHVLCMDASTENGTEEYSIVIEVSQKRDFESDGGFEKIDYKNIEYDKTLKKFDSLILLISNKIRKYLDSGIETEDGSIISGFSVSSIDIIRHLAGSNDNLFGQVIFTIENKLCKEV